MSRCSCGREAVYFARYSGQHLCPEHFTEFVERRVRRELRKQGPFKRGRIAVALSGGKDSVVTLRLMHEIFRDNPAVELSAVTIDEGIASYRPPSIVVAAEHCKEIGVEHLVLSYEETAGVTMDSVVQHPARTMMPCAYCGVMRRRNLNEAAKRAGAGHLATGHNLDDVAQTILMNHLKGDVDRLAKMGPHRPEHVQPGLIPRILPLRLIPEREVALYAILRCWSYHDGECPYAQDATRGRYRDLLLQLEEESPGTRHALVSGYDQLAPLLGSGAKALRACERCGEPCSGATCRACELIGSVGGRLLPGST
ncbi:MAG TPA: TIGR00269 family protein [Candidatus Thermoplasmatota archaeon]|nr:TIGR00269 family protein [Candidatus Thermoplasmatota archaeon]